MFNFNEKVQKKIVFSKIKQYFCMENCKAFPIEFCKEHKLKMKGIFRCNLSCFFKHSFTPFRN